MMTPEVVICFAIVLSFVGVNANEPGISIPFVQRNKDIIVNIHNDFRRTIYAADMQELNWSDGAAYTAEKWARRCHSHRPTDDPFGENVYLWETYNGDAFSEHFIVEAIKGWEKEGDDYTYWRRGCGHNHVCNYVQLVAAKTESVGCALVKCPVYFEHKEATKHDVMVFACFYAPFVDIIGQPPYLYGRQCSYCPRGYECNNGLCSDTSAQMWKNAQQPYVSKYETEPEATGFGRGDTPPGVDTSKKAMGIPPPPEDMTWVDGAPPSKSSSGYAVANTDKSSGEYPPPPPKEMTFVHGEAPLGKASAYAAANTNKKQGQLPPPPEDMTWVDAPPPSKQSGSYAAANKETGHIPPPPENMEFVRGQPPSKESSEYAPMGNKISGEAPPPPPPVGMSWVNAPPPSKKDDTYGAAMVDKPTGQFLPPPENNEFVQGQPPSKESGRYAEIGAKVSGELPPPPEGMTWVDGPPPSKKGGAYAAANVDNAKAQFPPPPENMEFVYGQPPSKSASKSSSEFPPPPEGMTWVDGPPPSKKRGSYAAANVNKETEQYPPPPENMEFVYGQSPSKAVAGKDSGELPPPPEGMTWVDGPAPSKKGGSYAAANVNKETEQYPPPPENMEFVNGQSPSKAVAGKNSGELPPPPEGMTWVDGPAPSKKGGSYAAANVNKETEQYPPPPENMEFVHGQSPSKAVAGKDSGELPPPPESMTWVDGPAPSKKGESYAAANVNKDRGQYPPPPENMEFVHGQPSSKSVDKAASGLPPPPEGMTWVDGPPPSKKGGTYAAANIKKDTDQFPTPPENMEFVYGQPPSKTIDKGSAQLPPPPERMSWVDGPPPSGKSDSYAPANIKTETEQFAPPPPENMEFVYGQPPTKNAAQNIATNKGTKDQSFPPPPEEMAWIDGAPPSKVGQYDSVAAEKQTGWVPPPPVDMGFIRGPPPSKIRTSSDKTEQGPPPPEDMTWVDGPPPSKSGYQSQKSHEPIRSGEGLDSDSGMKKDYIATVYNYAKDRGAGYFRRFPSAYNRQQPRAYHQPMKVPPAAFQSPENKDPSFVQAEAGQRSPKQQSSSVAGYKESVPYQVPFPNQLGEVPFPKYGEMKVSSTEFAYAEKPAALESSNGEIGSEEGHEVYYITSAHNQFRRENGLTELTWNDHLEKWARYVIRCDTEYPGPINCYTNFDSGQLGSRLESVVYDWTREKDEPISNHCRTPYDRRTCNHYTAISDVNIDEFACAALNCGYERKFVCIYK